MRISINLSSQPFRRDRPVIAATVVASALLLATLSLLVSLAIVERGRLRSERETIARLEGRMQKLTAEQARLEAVIRKPENAAVIDGVQFINSLIYRKGISWTRIFSDLEKVTPYNVRIISIRPTVTAQNQISLEINLGAESTQPVVEMLMKLEASEHFGATYVHNSLPPSQNDPLFRYRVSVNYAQKL